MKAEWEQKKLAMLDKAVSILSAEPKQPATPSEDETFGLLVAKTLSRLSDRQKILAKKKINDILFEAEMGNLGGGQFLPAFTMPATTQYCGEQFYSF